jgi:hypothetical protein
VNAKNSFDIFENKYGNSVLHMVIKLTFYYYCRLANDRARMRERERERERRRG